MPSAEVEYGVLPARLQSRLEQLSVDVAAAAGETCFRSLSMAAS
jgi:hypothetical protein